MFTAIRLKNFKCYKDTGDIPLRPLTLLVGPNNAGKSTILDAILMLKQTLQDKEGAALITAGPFVELGGFHDILRGGRKARENALSIVLTASPALDGRLRFGPGMPFHEEFHDATTLSVTFSFDSRSNRVRVSSVRFSDRGETVLEVRPKGSAWRVTVRSRQIRKHIEISFRHFFPLIRPLKASIGGSRLETMIAQLGALSRFQSIAWSRLFDRVRHVAPLRLPVPWYAILGRIPTSELGAGGENLLHILGSRAEIPGTKGALVHFVNEWMSNRFKMLGKLRLVNVDAAGTVRSLLADERSGFKGINVAGMGEGLSQLLPIVASVLTGEDRECVVMEQPEIHLHPAAQADLGDLFVEHIRRGKLRQFIIETHSEHLLLRIRRRIAEKRISPEKVAILYVERPGRESRVRHLMVDASGHFRDWPRGFFEEGYREALALAEAAAKPKDRRK